MTDNNYHFTLSFKDRQRAVDDERGDSAYDFIQRIRGEIMLGLAEEGTRKVMYGAAVGYLTAELFQGQFIAESGHNPVLLADDEEQELGGVVAAAYRSDGTFKQAFEGLEAFGGNLLFLRHLHIDPPHRGLNLGLGLMQEVLDLVPHDLAVLIARPLQFLNYRDRESPQGYEIYDGVTEKEGAAKLRRHYGKLGFEKIGKSGYLFRSPSVVNPTASLNLKSIKAILENLPESEERLDDLIDALKRAVASEDWGTVHRLAGLLKEED